MGAGNGKEPAPSRPLSTAESDEIRAAVGRLQNGARELATIALVAPIFLAGAELAAAGFSSAASLGEVTSTMFRDDAQRLFDHATFVAFFVACIALAIRARLGVSRARAILPDALSDEPAAREKARSRILRLAGARILRRAAERIAARWRAILLALVVIVAVAQALPVPNPIWLAVFAAIVVGLDVRWRAMIADVADQLPAGE